MTENNHICTFCNKSYSTVSALKLHQKTAKFCLSLQQNKTIENVLKCDFCDKTYLLKKSLLIHLSTCTEKIIYDRTIELRKQQEDIKKHYEKEILLLKQSLEFKEETIKQKDETIKEKDEIIKQKEHFIETRCIELMQNNNTTNNIYHTTNNSYTIQFNQYLDNLIPFTNENVKAKLETILPNQLLNNNDYNVEKNFIYEIVRAIKDFTFTTDSSRGKLIIKKEVGSFEKIQSEQFVINCIVPNKNVIYKIIDTTSDYAEHVENITPVDYVNAIKDLADIKISTVNQKECELFTKISNKLCKHVPHLTYNNKSQLISSTTN